MKKIVVVGAGSAGWLAASAIKKNCPWIDVQIVYDSNTPTVGVGETIGLTATWKLARLLGIDLIQYLEKIDGIFKYGSILEDWKYIGSREMSTHVREFDIQNLLKSNYALDTFTGEGVDIKDNGPVIADVWYTMYRTNQLDRPFDAFPLHGSPLYHFACNGKSTIDLDNNPLLRMPNGYAFNYDSELFGKTVSEIVGKPWGVKHIDCKVINVNTDETGITGLVLADGTIIDGADLYIDCSGFKHILMGALDNEWTAFDEFYNDSAVVTQIPYDNTSPVHSFRPITVISAMNEGWRFGVRTRSRIGNGYVFNSRQTNDIESVIDEFKTALGVDQDKSVRKLSWDPGYYKKILYKNCLAIGLSMGFGDPTDANNISLSTFTLLKLVTKIITQDNDISQVNDDVEKGWDEIDLRVQTVLRLSPRRDTKHYRLMNEVATETKLVERWCDHLSARRQQPLAHSHNCIVPLRAHIGTAVRYGIDLPYVDCDKSYFPLVNQYFNDMDRIGAELASKAPTAQDYFKIKY
jgi:tryptophan halogenase